VVGRRSVWRAAACSVALPRLLWNSATEPTLATLARRCRCPNMSIKISDVPTTTLRFTVGARVECNCGTWKPGTITKLFYSQKSFPEGMCVPYQVKLDEGKSIFAPADVDPLALRANLSASAGR
jgi:hypothetical protein